MDLLEKLGILVALFIATQVFPEYKAEIVWGFVILMAINLLEDFISRQKHIESMLERLSEAQVPNDKEEAA